MPGLLRAGRRLRPGQRADPAPTLDGDEWVIDGQKVWTSLRALGRLVLRARPHRARLRSGTTGLSYLLVPMRPGRASRSGRSSSSPAPRSSTRCSSTAPAPPPTSSSASAGDGWKVAMGTLGFERGVVHARPAGRLPARARRADRAGPRQRRGRRPGAPRPAGPGLGRARGHARSTRCARSADRGEARRASASIAKLLWASWHRGLGELAMDVRGADVAAGRGAPLRARRLAAAVPVHPRRHDLRRLRRDPAQHPRRAGARPAPSRPEGDRDGRARAAAARLRAGPRPAAPARSSWSPPRPAPASARPSCAGAASRRARRRRAQRHPRAPAGRGRGRRWPRSSARTGCWSLRLRRHRRGAGAGAARRRPTQFGGVDVMVNNAGPRRHRARARDDRRAVAQGPRRHPDRHVPLHPGGAAARWSRSGQAGRDRQQRLGASAGGPRRGRRTTPRPRPA